MTAVLERERPDALVPTLGGQTALNLAIELEEAGELERLGVRLLGAEVRSIRLAEDREAAPGSELGIRLGQRVRHKKFGDGVILNCEGQGAHARVEVNFESAGTKWLVLSYANLDLM